MVKAGCLMSTRYRAEAPRSTHSTLARALAANPLNQESGSVDDRIPVHAMYIDPPSAGSA
jgi:hypothetical protein